MASWDFSAVSQCILHFPIGIVAVVCPSRSPIPRPPPGLTEPTIQLVKQDTEATSEMAAAYPQAAQNDFETLDRISVAHADRMRPAHGGVVDFDGDAEGRGIGLVTAFADVGWAILPEGEGGDVVGAGDVRRRGGDVVKDVLEEVFEGKRAGGGSGGGWLRSERGYACHCSRAVCPAIGHRRGISPRWAGAGRQRLGNHAGLQGLR
ncbi:hypothetical protein B0H13DRAFT_1852004 [Mycena leptocephala]|nr:hypothetical protein B0H13DRAFT_1852004 [Mycena leptocephala]